MRIVVGDLLVDSVEMSMSNRKRRIFNGEQPAFSRQRRIGSVELLASSCQRRTVSVELST